MQGIAESKIGASATPMPTSARSFEEIRDGMFAAISELREKIEVLISLRGNEHEQHC